MMNEGKRVTLTYKGRIAILTLNRPEHRNALTEAMAQEFQQAVREIKDRSDLGCVILTGAGEAFCAGADLSMLMNWMKQDTRTLEQSLNRFYDAFLTLTDLEIPVLAAINGPAIGAGATLAMACDIRLAGSGVKMAFNFARLGLNPGMVSEALLSRAVGPARTMELLMTGMRLNAEEALEFGVVNRVVPEEEVIPQTMGLAQQIAAMPSRPIRIIKRLTHEAPARTLKAVARIQAHEQSLCYEGPDVTEGVRAVQERRDPRFHSQDSDSSD